MNPYTHIDAAERTAMSTEADTAPTQPTPEGPATEKPVDSTTPTATTPAKAIKKSQSKKDIKNDPSRFQPPGVNFNAKLIGVEDVASPRGDKMCQDSMQKLKLAVRATKEHKQKVVVNVSQDGIKIIDIKTLATNFTHPVHKISFISRDVTDSRAFGYVYGVGDGTHKFFAIKTEKAAEGLVLSLRDLFQVVYEMKKMEMEAAKKHQEEPEQAEEAKDEEKKDDAGQATKEGAHVENGDAVYQVPTNNAPVTTEPTESKSSLLDLEEELQTLGEGIEQMNTMESLFADFEVPASSSTTTSSSSTSSPWGDMFSSPQSTAPANTSAGMFSVGGAPFSANSPFSAPAPGSTVVPGPFGQPQIPQMGFPPGPQGGFGAGAQFGVPNVPPRTGMAPAGAFPTAGGFPPTPFPTGNVSPAFPGAPVRPGGSPMAPPANDPFASDPFSSGPGFGDEDVMQPARIENPEEKIAEVNKPKNAFDDLCSIGATDKRHKSPKDMFTELSAPPKKSLNELKVDTPGQAPPKSPVQASDPFGAVEDMNFDDFNVAFPGASNDPFDTSFVPNVAKTSQNSAHNPSQPPGFSTSFVSPTPSTASASAGSMVAATSSSLFNDDDFNLPSPTGPPPPLPASGLVSNSKDLKGPPVPPPRPNGTPPLPPRPKSSGSSGRNSVSSNSSITENSPMPNTPPLPPRPNVSTVISTNTATCTAVPRPRPRTMQSQSSVATSGGSHISETESQTSVKGVNSCSDSKGGHPVNNSVLVSESQGRVPVTQKKSNSKVSISVSDPFATTDPFASDDPFTSADPFDSDPFSSDPFKEPVSNCITTSDPFAPANPRPASTAAAPVNRASDDPFAVFDKAFNSEPFTFEKSNKMRVKLKVPVTQ